DSLQRMSSIDSIDRHHDLLQDSALPTWLSDHDLTALIRIIASCFSGVDAEAYLDNYFLAVYGFSRRLRLFYADSRLVGYCLITFRKQGTSGKRTLVLVGASAGFLPAHRHGNHTLRFSMEAAIGYKLR